MAAKSELSKVSSAETTGRLRMVDLARLAGVSISTVSRALANSPLVPAEKRAEIHQLASTHGFVVDQGARRLRLRRTETVAIVIPLGHEQGQPISDPFFLELVGHLADEITARGYDVLLTRAPAPRPGWLTQLIQSGRADGILVIGQSDQHDALNEAAVDFLPLVVWGALQTEQVYCSVGVDNFGGGRALAEHLLSQGRTRLAYLGASRLPELKARLDGCCAALSAAGLELRPELIIETHLLGSSVAAPVETLLRAGTPFDAVFGATDVIAAAAMRALRAAKVRVPRDIAVTGFDDVALAAHASPPLTTVRQDLAMGARTMVDLLFRRLAGEAAPSVVMSADLVVRASSITPPRRHRTHAGQA